MWKYFKLWDIVTRPEQGKISLEQFILDVLISLLQIQITQPPTSCFSVVIFIMSQINCLIFWNLSYGRKCQADQLKSRSSFIDTKNRHYYNLYFSEFTQDLIKESMRQNLSSERIIQITTKYYMVILYLHHEHCQEYLGLQGVSGTSP